jgi:hypothetical protein
MEDDVLTQVISVEKELQTRLEAEQGMAREWVEQVRREAEEDLAREEALLRESLARAAGQAGVEAEARAGLLIRKAEEQAALLLDLDEEILRRTVMQRLGMILRE